MTPIVSIPHTLYRIFDLNILQELRMILHMDPGISLLRLYRCRIKELCRVDKQINLASNVGGDSPKGSISIIYDLRSSTRCLAQQVGRRKGLIRHVRHKEVIADTLLESLTICSRGSDRAMHGRQRKSRSQQLIKRRVLTYNPFAQEEDRAVLVTEQTTNLRNALDGIKPKVLWVKAYYFLQKARINVT